MKILSFLLLPMLGATTVSAEGLLVERSYVFYAAEFAQKDASCIDAVENHIAPKFRGLRTISVQSGHIFRTSNGSTALYPEVSFNGDYGNAIGSISCIFSLEEGVVTDVIVAFLGDGLGGSEKRALSSGSKDPVDWKTIGSSVSLSH